MSGDMIEDLDVEIARTIFRWNVVSTVTVVCHARIDDWLPPVHHTIQGESRKGQQVIWVVVKDFEQCIRCRREIIHSRRVPRWSTNYDDTAHLLEYVCRQWSLQALITPSIEVKCPGWHVSFMQERRLGLGEARASTLPEAIARAALAVARKLDQKGPCT